MRKVIELNEANFDREVVESKRPIVVDFWAEWCGPCRMLAPVLEEIAQEQEGRAVVAKVNIDQDPGLASRFGIQSIPTLLYFSGGKVREQTVGVVSKRVIANKLLALARPTETSKA